MSSSSAPVGATAGDAERLLKFNCQLIDQALALLAAHDGLGAPAYEHYTGPHLRHVVEHYEALVLRDADSVVDYDSRPRDRELERDAHLARARLTALRQQMTSWSDAMLDKPLFVRGQGGLTGEFDFVTRSSMGRELMFLASHAIHHYALLQVYCERHGIATHPSFGLAPSTVAHARGANADIPPIASKKELACPTFQPAA
ncbi:MAG: hypothetical protein ACKVOX_06425 [Rhizobacter sp.]